MVRTSLWPFYEPRGLPGPAYSEQIQRVQEGLRLAGLREYAEETTDFGAAPIRSLSPDPVGQTPLSCPGAMTIHTPELVRLVQECSPVLIDVALGSWGKSLPGAVGLQGTGHGAEFSERVQNRTTHKIIDLTKNDLAAPVVVFCRNSNGLRHKPRVRLISLGCTTIYWYRGGFEAWLSNNLPSGDLGPTRLVALAVFSRAK